MASTTSNSAASGTQSNNPSCPAFLSKLWLLVEDEITDDLIHWSLEGNSFIVVDQAVFASQLLPLYFKHSNMASFIRQLNMYGFRKKAHIEDGALKTERTDIEFQHPHFLRGQIIQLEQIKRKVSGKEESKLKTNEVSKILSEVQGMKDTQNGITGKLESMRRENQALWREVVSLRQRHDKQQKIVNRLIHFLISLVQPKVGTKRRQNHLMIEGVPDGSSHSNMKYARTLPMRATIDELPVVDVEPKQDTNLDFLSGNALGSSATLSDITGDLTNTPSPSRVTELFRGDDLLTATVPDEANAPTSADKPQVMHPPQVPVLQANSPNVTFPLTPGQESYTSGGSPEDPAEIFGLEGVMKGDSEDSLVGGTGEGPSELVVPNSSSEICGFSPQKDSAPSRAVVQRALSHEEQKQEIGEQLNYVQANLNDFQNLFLGSSPLNLELGGLVDEFQQIFDMTALPSDALSSLATESNGSNTSTYLAGNEMVTYTPSTSIPLGTFLYEDDDSLLKSLDDDSIALSKQEQQEDGNLASLPT